MTETCTCGAVLPPDALFCHKCGRPVREVLPPDEERTVEIPPLPAEALIAVPPPPPPPSGIGLRNPVAARIALVAGSVTSMLLYLPLPALIQLLWQLVVLVAGGFWAVYLYQRRTGSYLTVRSGAHLGWLTGIFSFLVMMVMFTFSIAVIASGAGLRSFFREMVAQRGTPELMEQFDAILSSPAGIGALLFGILITFFFMLTIPASVGGALGAPFPVRLGPSRVAPSAAQRFTVRLPSSTVERALRTQLLVTCGARSPSSLRLRCASRARDCR